MFDVINKYFDVIEEDEAEDDGDENDVDEDVDDEDEEEVEEHEPVFATQVGRECCEHLKPEILNNLMFHKVFWTLEAILAKIGFKQLRFWKFLHFGLGFNRDFVRFLNVCNLWLIYTLVRIRLAHFLKYKNNYILLKAQA